MNETTRTLTFAGVAFGLLAVASLVSWGPGLGGASADFDEQGKTFFPAFAKAVEADPLSAKVLEVIEYDPDDPQITPFQVQLQDGAWTLPSHYDYPAKAADKMAKLAAAVAQLKKDAIRSDRPDDHERLGVIDPLDAKATSLKGRGTHVTLRDRPGGEPLADFIVGAADPDHPGKRFVRQAGKNRVYEASVDLDLSTDFANWIEPDLVNIAAADVTKVTYDTSKVDPDKRQILRGDPIVLDKVKPSPTAGTTAGATWKLEGIAADQQTDGVKVDDVLRAVDGLRVVGVRPLPQRGTAESVRRSLAGKGFYLLSDGSEFLSNEGNIQLDTDKGLSYTLRFGEVTFATGDTLTAGTDEEKQMAGADLVKPDPSADPKAQDDAKKSEGTESRYVIVNVEFDPNLIPAADPDADKLPDDVFAKPADDPARVEAEKKAKADAEARQTERERLIAEGEKQVAELNERFAKWYYVVPGADFRRVVVGRDAFIKKPGDPATPAAGAPSGLPADPHGGLPPGFNLPGLGGPGAN